MIVDTNDSFESRQKSPPKDDDTKNMTEINTLVPYVPPEERNLLIPTTLSSMVSSVSFKEQEDAMMMMMGDDDDDDGLAVLPSLPPQLPNEMIWNILYFVDAQTLSRASCVCRDWQYFATRNDLWETLCRNQFGVSASQLTPPPDPTKSLYIMTHIQFKDMFRRTKQKSLVPPSLLLLQQQHTAILSAFQQF